MAPYAPAPSAFDIGQENLFTIFEMAPGEGGMATSLQANEAGVGLEDYSFTDDYDTGGDHGVDDNALDLSEAESEGSETDMAFESPGAGDFDTGGTGGLTSYSDDIGPNDFELDLSEALAEQVIASNAPPTDVEAPPMAAAAMQGLGVALLPPAMFQILDHCGNELKEILVIDTPLIGRGPFSDMCRAIDFIESLCNREFGYPLPSQIAAIKETGAVAETMKDR